MRFHIITLFPESFDSYLNSSMLKRAQAHDLISIDIYNPREETTDNHQTVDARPYGGGPGMVLMAEPILRTYEKILKQIKKSNPRGKKISLKTIILSPRGKVLSNDYARKYIKKFTDIIFIAGHYEGIDARVRKILKAEELSIGPYVLTGGELPAMVAIDCMSRQVKGVLGKQESLEEERLVVGEVYTRPEIFVWNKKKHKVPPVLLSGNHKKITDWKVKKIK